MKSASFDASVVGTVTPPTPHLEFRVAHDLGYTPGEAFLLDKGTKTRVYRGPTSWNETHIFLRASVPGAALQLFIIGGTVKAGSTFVATQVRALPWINITADVGTALTNTWPDATTQNLRCYAIIPPDYLSGAVTLAMFRRGNAATGGTAVMQRTTVRSRAATALTTIDSAVNINFTDTGDTNDHLHTWTVAAASIQAGDTIRIDIQRIGGDAGDTYAGAINFNGGWIEYTAPL